MWLIMAALSALFAGLTAILAKCGIKKTDSDVATALRTVVVLLFAWIMVFIVGSAGTITEISAKSIIFLILSGFATGASWICYFKALSVGDVNKVVPVDKSSTVLVLALLDAAARISAKCAESSALIPSAVRASVTISDVVARSSPEAAARFIIPSTPFSI